jgi:hypothetical protein
MLKNKTTPLLAIIVLMLAAGCAKYKPKPLPNVMRNTEKSTHVDAYAYTMTRSECEKTFSRNAKKHGLQAVHLTLANNTNQALLLQGKNISVDMEDRTVVAETLKIDVAHRTLSWAVPGLILGGLLFIPAVYEYFASTTANKALIGDFNRRVIDSDSRCTIEPGQTLSKVFFIPVDSLQTELSITLLNEKNDKAETINVVLQR